MICSQCGTQNKPGRRFCVECGSALAAACPSCGSAVEPGEKFCGTCGTPLAPAPAPVSAAGAAAVVPGPVGAYGVAGPVGSVGPAPSAGSAASPGAAAERRLVSILFADLVGFTPFAEERDAEEVRETLSRYFEIASEVIRRYGGTVEKFIGDAVMAVWGAPTAQEDDAERAVRAALELVDAVPQLGPGIAARAAVLTGEAAVTLGARDQGLVAGDLVNTAARLQAVAPPGTVLVGEATHRAAASSITFAAAGEHLLKGKVAPVAAWQALRVVAQRGGQGRSDLPEPPFVGRSDELRLLREAVTATGRDRRPRLVSVTGPGGIGKSRLAWELEKWIDGVSEPIYWHRGRSPAYGDGITFWALGEMVRRRAGLAEGDDEAATRERVAATVARFVPEPADRAWVEPALLALLGVEAPPPGGREVLFAAWRIFFERISAQGTTVLLFEDLQWADTGLLDFIDHLLDWSKGVPLLVVTLARPELFDRRPDWGAARRSYTAMALEPLTDAAMRELLAGFVPGLPPATTDTILRRADGIPLYAVETVRALVADGRLRHENGAYRPTGDLSEIAIPETLRSLIAARLDALDPADRALVSEAAVLGQVFTRASLAALSGRPEQELDGRLRTLVRREVLELEADPRSPERGQYGFVQALIREVAYATLARKERRALHLAAARFLEAAGEGELAGVLAAHYLAAWQASAEGPERDAAATQARIALRAAAERAAGLGAHDQAVEQFGQAIEIAASPAERAALEMAAAASAGAAGEYDRADVLANAAIGHFREAGDPSGAARATAELGVELLHAGQVERSREVLAAALAELPPDAPEEVRARLLANLSRALMRLSRDDEAIAMADRALTVAERLDLDEVVAEALNNKAAVISHAGRWRESTRLLEAAIEIAHAGGFVAAELRARSNLASTLFYTWPERARRMQMENADLALRLGNRTMALWMADQVISTCWLTARDWDRALDLAQRMLPEARSPVDEARIQSGRAWLLISRGEPADAELRIVEALASAPSAEVDARVAPLFLRAEAAVLDGRDREAYDLNMAATVWESVAALYLYEAGRAAVRLGDAVRLRGILDRLATAPNAESRLVVAHRKALAAGLDAIGGRRDEAIAGYRDAWRRYRDLETDGMLARSVVDALLVLAHDAAPLLDAVDEARATFTRVGARPHLARLDAALAAARLGMPGAATAPSPSTAASLPWT